MRTRWVRAATWAETGKGWERTSCPFFRRLVQHPPACLVRRAAPGAHGEGGGAMNKSSDPITTGLRWTARILGAGILGLFALFYFGTGGPDVWKGPANEMILMVALLISVAGLAVA